MVKIIKNGVLLVPVLILISCRKDYTCQCKTSSATYDAGSVEKTKRQAKKYCKELSSEQTTCSLKN